MRKKSYNEWEDEQPRRDPDWDRRVREVAKLPSTKRKVPLLLDENLEAQIVAELSAVRGFRVAVAPGETEDPKLWELARRTKALLVTCDLDFWNDRRYPLAQSPGVIIGRGKTASHKIESLAMAFGSWDIVGTWRRVPWWLEGVKVKASLSEVQANAWRDGVVVTFP